MKYVLAGFNDQVLKILDTELTLGTVTSGPRAGKFMVSWHK